MKPEVGMRIIMNFDLDEDSFLEGRRGVINHFVNGHIGVAIHFDKYHDSMHTCQGRVEDGHGWYVHERTFTLESEERALDDFFSQLRENQTPFDQALREPCSLTQPKPKEETHMSTKWLPETFTFAGQRVILNPESDRYKRMIRDLGGKDLAGYVLDHQASDGDLDTILKSGDRHIPSWSVRVRFDNEVVIEMRVKDLLQVESFKKVTHYKIKGYGDARIIEGINEALLDKLIILEGLKIQHTSTKVYGEQYKNKKIADAYLALGKS